MQKELIWLAISCWCIVYVNAAAVGRFRRLKLNAIFSNFQKLFRNLSDLQTNALSMNNDYAERACDASQFQCTRRLQCVSKDFVCNGRTDCWDNSDEDREMCCRFFFLIKRIQSNLSFFQVSRDCPLNNFKCKSGTCIPNKWVCDEHTDCSDGGSDEANCREFFVSVDWENQFEFLYLWLFWFAFHRVDRFFGHFLYGTKWVEYFFIILLFTQHTIHSKMMINWCIWGNKLRSIQTGVMFQEISYFRKLSRNSKKL